MIPRILRAAVGIWEEHEGSVGLYHQRILILPRVGDLLLVHKDPSF